MKFPIDGDDAIEELFVQFLGDRALYERCCAEANLDNDEEDDFGLTLSERLAIWVYSSTDDGWYARINGELWNGPCSEGVLLFAEVLDAALDKLPPYEGQVYRGYTASDLDAFLDQYGVGALIRWPGFTSSSLDPEKAFAGNVLFIIRSQSGRILGDYADKPFEDEVLFPKGSLYLVTSLERRENFAIIELEERPK